MAPLETTTTRRLLVCWGNRRCYCWYLPAAPGLNRFCFAHPAARERLIEDGRWLFQKKRSHAQKLHGGYLYTRSCCSRSTSSCSTWDEGGRGSSTLARNPHGSTLEHSRTSTYMLAGMSTRYITVSTSSTKSTLNDSSSHNCYAIDGSLQDDKCLPRNPRDLTRACTWMPHDTHQPHRTIRVVPAASTSSVTQDSLIGACLPREKLKKILLDNCTSLVDTGLQKEIYVFHKKFREILSCDYTSKQPDEKTAPACTVAYSLSAPVAGAKQPHWQQRSQGGGASGLPTASFEGTQKINRCLRSEIAPLSRAGDTSGTPVGKESAHASSVVAASNTDVLRSFTCDICCDSTSHTSDHTNSEHTTVPMSLTAANSNSNTWHATRAATDYDINPTSGCSERSSDAIGDSFSKHVSSNCSTSPTDRQPMTRIRASCDCCSTAGDSTLYDTSDGSMLRDSHAIRASAVGHTGTSGRNFTQRKTIKGLPLTEGVLSVEGAITDPVGLPAARFIPAGLAISANSSVSTGPTGTVQAPKKAQAVGTGALTAAVKKAATGSAITEVSSRVSTEATFDHQADSGIVSTVQRQWGGKAFACQHVRKSALAMSENKRGDQDDLASSEKENLLEPHVNGALEKAVCTYQQPRVSVDVSVTTEKTKHINQLTDNSYSGTYARPQGPAETPGETQNHASAHGGVWAPLCESVSDTTVRQGSTRSNTEEDAEASGWNGDAEFEEMDEVFGDFFVEGGAEGGGSLSGRDAIISARGGEQQDCTAAYMRYMACMPLTVEEEEKIKQKWDQVLRDGLLCWQLQRLWGFPFTLLIPSQVQRHCLHYFKQQVRQRPLLTSTKTRTSNPTHRELHAARTTTCTHSCGFPSSRQCSRSSSSPRSTSPDAGGPTYVTSETSPGQKGTVIGTTSAATAQVRGLTEKPLTAAERGAGDASVEAALAGRGVRRAAVIVNAAQEAEATAVTASGAPCIGATTDIKRVERAITTPQAAGTVDTSKGAANATNSSVCMQQQQDLMWRRESVEGGQRMRTVLFILKHLRAAAAGRPQALPVALVEAIHQTSSSRKSRRMHEVTRGSSTLATNSATVQTTYDEIAVSPEGPPSDGCVARARQSPHNFSTLLRDGGAAAGAALWAGGPPVRIVEDGNTLANKKISFAPVIGRAQNPAGGDLTGSILSRIPSYFQHGADDREMAQRERLIRLAAAMSTEDGGVCIDTYRTLLQMQMEQRATAPQGNIDDERAAGEDDNTLGAAIGPPFSTSLSPSFVAGASSNRQGFTHGALAETAGSHSASSNINLAEAAPLLCLMRWYIAEKHADHVLQYLNLKRLADLRSPFAWYPAARSLNRDIILHAGPPNSGKTAAAVDYLLRAATGCYLAPLRLLAWEVYVRLKQCGLKVSLITGQERCIHKGATHLCCTVEAAPLNSYFACGVIDEGQLLSNSQRGDAWTRALLGLPAHQLHVCCEERAVPLLQKLFLQCREICSIRRYQRLAPLYVDQHPVGDLDALCTGDCLVCFTRADVLKLRKQLHTRGFDVYIIYGQLPPAVKQRQADLFNAAVQRAELQRSQITNSSLNESLREGNEDIMEQPTAASVAAPAALIQTTTAGPPTVTAAAEAYAPTEVASQGRSSLRVNGRAILIATDAIGLGLNLHIRRIVFYRLQKYAGTGDGAARRLTTAEIRQLAGRAGRRSGVYGEAGGLVTCMEGEDFERVKQALEGEAQAEQLERAALVPSLPQLVAFCEELERKETAGNPSADTRRDRSLSDILSSLATPQNAHGEPQTAGSNDTLASHLCEANEPARAPKEVGNTSTSLPLHHEKDMARKTLTAITSTAGRRRRVPASARYVRFSSDPRTCARPTNSPGHPAHLKEEAASQSTFDSATAASDSIHTVRSPSSSWQYVASSYAEAVRCFISLLQVDSLYFVPPHKLNLMLTVVHALADVPLSRQQLFTFCLAPLPFSSPYPFLKHTQKGEKRSHELRKQSSVERHANEWVHGQGPGTAAEEGQGANAVGTRSETMQAVRRHATGATAVIACGAAGLAAAQRATLPLRAEADITAKDGKGFAEEGKIHIEAADVADATGVEGIDACLPAAALAAAGLSLMLLNALRTFAVLLATCGHVPLPPHVCTAACDVASACSSTEIFAPSTLHSATTSHYPEHGQEPTTLKQQFLSEHQQRQHLGYCDQQKQRVFSKCDSASVAGAAVSQDCWRSSSYSAVAAAEEITSTHLRAAENETGDNSIGGCSDGTHRAQGAADVCITGCPIEPVGADWSRIAVARGDIVPATGTVVQIQDTACAERYGCAEPESFFTAHAAAQEEEKRYAERLLVLEESYQIVDLYMWLARKFPAAFVDLSLASQVQRALTEAIDTHLRSPW